MVQFGPTGALLWLGMPTGQFLEKQWHSEHRATDIFVKIRRDRCVTHGYLVGEGLRQVIRRDIVVFLSCGKSHSISI